MVIESILNKLRRFPKSWLFLLVIILFVVLVRVRLLDFPLERDEGEYAYMGQLILQGIPPYGEAYNMKFPGTYLMYALIMGLFGQTIEGIHIGLAIVNCATILLVYRLARKIVDDFPAAIAGGTYAVLSLSSSVVGFAGHATHFVVLPTIGGTLLLLRARGEGKPYLYFLSGLLLGLSLLMKQPGIFFFLFGAAYILYDHFSSRPALSIKALFLKLGAISLGASLPLLVTLLWLYAAGVFDMFWFWAFEYAPKYGSQVPFSMAFTVFKESFSRVVDGFFLLWAIGALGFLTVLFRRDFTKNKVFVILFTFFSFLTVCPGFYFRNHYFITFLPALSLLVGGFFDWSGKQATVFVKSRYVRIVSASIFLVAISLGIVDLKGYFFVDDPVRLSRTVYGANPFPESIEIARFIEARSSAADRVAVFGSEPQIYFYAHRRSATGFIYTYSLVEIHKYSLSMQKEMINEIESSQPKFIVDVPVDTSWLIRPESNKFIFGWIDDYLSKNYSLVGVADIISPDITVYKWGEDAANYRVLSAAHVLIYERR